MNFDHLQKTDPTLFWYIEEERERQETSLELIPSECIASLSTIEALGSPFTNKYSEGYVGKRYYWGNEVVDKVEQIAIDRAKELFWVEHVNVQPYSGSPANFAVYNAICEAGDTTMGLSLVEGGHLTHGHAVSATGKFFNAIQYGLNEKGYLDMDQVEKLALEQKPKLIWCGTTAYSRAVDFQKFGEIADKVGAYLVADISHISGLVATGAHQDPVPHVHIITTTTHKTLRGPRGGMIMVSKKGLDFDPELAKKIDKSVFPGLQWGPHNHQTLAIAVALWEALKPEFQQMSHQIVKNAKALAMRLIEHGFDLAAGGTDNHLILMSVGKGRGQFMQDALDIAGITMNKNTIPNEPCSPFHPSGVRMGTPIMTMRGMKEEQMVQVADWMKRVFDNVASFEYSEDKEERKKILQAFTTHIQEDTELQTIRKEVAELCSDFPIYQ